MPAAAQPHKSNNPSSNASQSVRKMGMGKKKAPPEPCGSGGAERGGDLLSRPTRGSTIGAGGLNFSVRDGKRWSPAAIATGKA